MKKEDLKIGRKLQDRIENIDARIDRLKGDQEDGTEKPGQVHYIEIKVNGSRTIQRVQRSDDYTEKAQADLEYLNRFYRDNVLRTLENCKTELEREFELLGEEGEVESEE